MQIEGLTNRHVRYPYVVRWLMEWLLSRSINGHIDRAESDEGYIWDRNDVAMKRSKQADSDKESQVNQIDQAYLDQGEWENIPLEETPAPISISGSSTTIPVSMGLPPEPPYSAVNIHLQSASVSLEMGTILMPVE